MTKWEYRVVDLLKEIEKRNVKTGRLSGQWLKTSDLEEVLNKVGDEGWELVHIHFILKKEEPVVVGFFKRPIQR